MVHYGVVKLYIGKSLISEPDCIPFFQKWDEMLIFESENLRKLSIMFHVMKWWSVIC